MGRTILTYGPIAGLVIIASIILGLELGAAQEWLGYLVMFIAFSTIFFAVRQYRDESLGGVIGFMPALLLGLGISAAAGIMYVAVWEIYLAVTDFGFIEQYSAAVIEAKQQAGASAEEIDTVRAEMDGFRAQYRNPVFRLPLTFLEVFPPGLLVSIGCAAYLRNRRSA